MPDLGPLWRLAALALLIVGLAGCDGARREAAPDPVPPTARVAHDGPASVTLLTVKNVRSGTGDHAALLIEGSERVLYDPAGSFELANLARRNDVIFGITPDVEQVYLGYHARATHDVIVRTLPLRREDADALIAVVEATPPARPGLCATRSSAALRTLPGLEGLSRSPFPRSLGQSFAAKSGVTNRRVAATDVPLWARTRGPGFVPDPGPADSAPPQPTVAAQTPSG